MHVVSTVMVLLQERELGALAPRLCEVGLISFSFHCRLFYKRVGELGLIIFGCVFGGSMYTFQAISSTTTMIFLCAYHSSSFSLNLVEPIGIARNLKWSSG